MKPAFAMLLLTATTVQACINDRDTLAFEMRNVDASNRITLESDPVKRSQAVQELVLRAISGRFERYPTQYYRMRIARLTARPYLSAAEWDDISVAHDRLGNVDDAIRLILASKEYRLNKDDEYRFHANYGTFLAHRWIKGGHKDSATLKASIREIEAALKINPNSHFGRERMQLALENAWLSKSRWVAPSGTTREDVLVGLSGIAMMGLGYELPDIYVLMLPARVPGGAGASLLTAFAANRAQELIDGGTDVLLSDNDYAALFRVNHVADKAPYRELRADGEQVYQARLAYMRVRFAKGQHPDTDRDFWSDWKEPALPVLIKVPDPTDPIRQAYLIVVGCLIAVPIVVFLLLRRRSKSR